AISLAGEPAMFPKLKELIDILHKKGKSTFVVTNGMFPDMVEKIEPTQLYVSIDAPNKELFMKIDKPIYKDAWQRFNNTLDALAKKKSRTAVRITLIKGRNIEDIEGYAALVKKSDADFVEVKAYMFVGSSRERLEMENMPLHNEVREFAENLEKHLNGWKIVDEQEESRVVLLAKSKDTKIKF
ncbi:radical SAM protein, partial [Candidatus Woesearchaeota archaeon]|nr:radical SAM protein [Candidatus Woesearchaeota archaeon]